MASQAKAAVIAKAINDAFAAQFKQLGESVTVGNTVVTKTIKARGASFPDIMATYGSLVIPGVPMNKNPLVFTENGVMGEGGNGGRFIPPPGPSPGSRGSLERSIPGVQTVATGENAHGYPSEVDFGLVRTYIAEVTPTPRHDGRPGPSGAGGTARRQLCPRDVRRIDGGSVDQHSRQ